MLTQGGPANATQVLGTYIYLQAFNLTNMGYANAIAVVLLVIAVVARLDAAQGEPEGMMSRFRLASIVLYGLVSLWSLFVLMPLLWMVFAAFKTRREIFTDPLGLPDTLNFHSFERAWGVGRRPVHPQLGVRHGDVGGADRRSSRAWPPTCWRGPRADGCRWSTSSSSRASRCR